MFPIHSEKKLYTIFQVYSKRLFKRNYKKLVLDKKLDFDFTVEEKKEIIRKLTSVAFEVNNELFEQWRTLTDEELVRNDLVGAKAWIKKNIEILTDGKNVEKLEKIRLKRINETIKEYNRDLKVFNKNGKVNKNAVKFLKQDIANNRASREIKNIVSQLEKGTFTHSDLKTLEKWHSRRNELIARNETGNLYAQEVKDLMLANDMEFYVWRTMKDSRVRPEHAEREGKKYHISESPLPAEEFNCRCFAEPFKYNRSE